VSHQPLANLFRAQTQALALDGGGARELLIANDCVTAAESCCALALAADGNAAKQKC
jgi:hypothetical protein